ncbi:hypothetical protein EZI54_01410, partial [Marinobacter halodurans]
MTGGGHGLADGQPRYVGGSHGGRGGNYSNDSSLAGYGSIAEPATLGYGGRYSDTVRGGGALTIRADVLDLSGQISSHGIGQYYGSGAGGSVWIDAGTLRVSEAAAIGATGGYSRVYGGGGGGGGGGRVHVQYTALDGNLASITSADGNGYYNDTRSGGAGTVLLENKGSGERILIIHNRYRNGNWTEIDSLPEGLDEIRISNARVKLDVASVPKLVVDNATLELTVPEVSQLDATSGSNLTVNADHIGNLTAVGGELALTAETITSLQLDGSTASLSTSNVETLEATGSTVTQSQPMTVNTLTLSNGSRWEQAGYSLTVDDYSFQDSTFGNSGDWTRPQADPNSLNVTGYTLTIPGGSYTYDRLEIGSGGRLHLAPYEDEAGTGGTLDLDVGELVIAEDGILDANGAGYQLADGQPRYVGGSHGGRGGNYSNSSSLAGYGSIAEPVTLGYGGRHSDTVRGGGALKIRADVLDLAGQISSHGVGQYYGSGAGGSVWIDAGTLRVSETAAIGAKGGYGRQTGGGGGRVHVQYTTLDGDLASVTSADGNGYYDDTRSGGAGTVLLEDKDSSERILIIHNRHRNGNWTEIDSLPEGLDEIRISNARVKLDVPSVPKLVVDNAILELTVPEVSQLDATSGSNLTINADHIGSLTAAGGELALTAEIITSLQLDGSTVSLSTSNVETLEATGSTVTQSQPMTVNTLTLSNGSRWEQAGYSLAVDDYSFQDSTFDNSGAWTRPQADPNSLNVTGYTLTIPGGSYTYDRLEIGSGGRLHLAPYEDEAGTGGTLDLDVGELVIAEDGILDANGAGYQLADGQPRYVGGSHGGRGGNYSNSSSLAGYGSIAEPATLGYGGRSSDTVRGGGVLKIRADVLDLAGQISSHGMGQYYGSGAGGSVWIDAGTLRVSETAAIGAKGGYGYYGAGGGGRVHVQYTTLYGDLASVTSADGNGYYDDTRSGGAGTVLLEDKDSSERILIIHNRHRNGNWTEIDSLPEGLDEIRISNARVKLDVASVPKLVVDNATLELTVPEVSQLDATSGSNLTVNADHIGNLTAVGG